MLKNKAIILIDSKSNSNKFFKKKFIINSTLLKS